MKPEREDWLKDCEDYEPGLCNDDQAWEVFEAGYKAGVDQEKAECPHFFTMNLDEADDRKAARRENMFFRMWTAARNNGAHDRKEAELEATARKRYCPFRKTATGFIDPAGISTREEEFMHCMGHTCMAWNHGIPTNPEDVCLALTPRRVTYEQNS